MASEQVGPEPTVDGCLVWLQDIFTQPETSVKKDLVVSIGGVQVMHEADQTVVVEVGPAWS